MAAEPLGAAPGLSYLLAMAGFEPPYPVIKEALGEGRVIPFLGSGASLGNGTSPWLKETAACLPTAGDLARHLAYKAKYPQDEPEQLTTIAQYYRVAVGADGLKEELHEIFARDYEVPRLHRFLATVAAPLLLVTTNYDELVERAFRDAGRPFDLVVHTTELGLGDRDQLLWWQAGASEPEKVSPKRLDIDLATTTVIYKMHGTVDRHRPERDQYVISEDDYIDFLTRMTKGKAIPAVFARPFQDRHFLFLGYSLRDWNLRVVLNRIEKDLRRPKEKTSWAIDAQPSPLETRFWQKRSVEIYAMTIASFVEELENA
jgi:SIR2-like domain